MPHVKIPRKSTAVDMTAMCDVAFLLLSFFILATKQKPDEALSVQIPNSISAKAAPDKAIVFTLTKEGKTFISMGEDTKRTEVLENLSLNKGLGLTPAEITTLSKREAIGVALPQLKGLATMANKPQINEEPGIPYDSANNELVDWVRSITNVYAGEDQRKLQEMLLVKGDKDSKYPQFKALKDALKKNELFKFRVITSGQPVPINSELYRNSAGLPVKED